MSVVQWKSWTEPHKMRLISGNPGQNLTSCAPSPEILDKTSQDAPHPRKSWTKPHKMSPSPEILDKTSQDGPHPQKSGTKPHTMRPIPGNTEITLIFRSQKITHIIFLFKIFIFVKIGPMQNCVTMYD